MSDTNDRQGGFTLVEMMAVLLIIALMTTVVLMSSRRQEPEIKAQGKLILRQFDILGQDSIISGKAQAFGLTEDSYVFYTFSDDQWTVTSENEWPEDATIQFFREDIEIDLPDDPIPLILFDPVGLSTPFTLEIAGDEGTLVLTGEGDGRVYMETEL